MSRIHSYSEAVNDLDAYIAKGGGRYSAWYCGIAADPKERLFDDHNVDRENGPWIRRDCGTDTVARQVEGYFHKKGCDGGSGGGDRNTKYVYAYKITSSTEEAA